MKFTTFLSISALAGATLVLASSDAAERATAIEYGLKALKHKPDVEERAANANYDLIAARDETDDGGNDVSPDATTIEYMLGADNDGANEKRATMIEYALEEDEGEADGAEKRTNFVEYMLDEGEDETDGVEKRATAIEYALEDDDEADELEKRAAIVEEQVATGNLPGLNLVQSKRARQIFVQNTMFGLKKPGCIAAITASLTKVRSQQNI
jgi:hypothetical protein